MPFYENIKDNLLKGKLVLNSFIKTLQYIYIYIYIYILVVKPDFGKNRTDTETPTIL